MKATNSEGVTTFTTPSDREITISRVVEAPRALVFDVHTQPEHVAHWLLGPPGWTMSACEIDLRPGGAYRYAWRHADGRELEISGAYREVVPPQRIVTTESMGGDWPETLNTLVLSEEDGRTTITTTILYPSKDSRDAAMRSGMKDGVSQSFERLADYLRTPAVGG